MGKGARQGHLGGIQSSRLQSWIYVSGEPNWMIGLGLKLHLKNRWIGWNKNSLRTSKGLIMK